MGIKFNAEGYYDPTAHEALINVVKAEKSAFFPIVYICSPYAGDIEKNTNNARKYCRFAYEQNTIPFASHLLFTQFMDNNNMSERKRARHFNYVMLGKCKELWVFGSVISQGMSHEISVAEKRKMKIRYFGEDCVEVEKHD